MTEKEFKYSLLILIGKINEYICILIKLFNIIINTIK